MLAKLQPAFIITRREIRDQLRDWRIIIPIVILTIFFPYLMNFTAERAINFVAGYGANIIGERLIPFLLMVVGFFPASFSLIIALESFVGEIDLTNHAAEQMYSDKRGKIPLPTNEELLNRSNKIFEYHERQDRLGRIQKAHFRIGHLNEDFDYTYVVARGGVIVTSWANDKGDNHRLTESHSIYIQQPEE